MPYQLGILDQSPIFPNETSSDAFKHSIKFAQDAEKWGYKRFWLSEHHNMENVAGSSPEILISHLLAYTEKINIGSGGVMLQHYSPYKVVENFHVLASLTPGRVDLGVGKAPGGFDLSTKALQYGTVNDGSDFNERLAFIKQLIDDNIPTDHPLANIKAKPKPIIKPDIYLLGGSENSAKYAAELEIDFVFARFLNNNEEDLQNAARIFKEIYSKGKLIVAVAVLAAETTEKAAALASELSLYEVTFSTGRSLLVQSFQQVEELQRQTKETFDVKPKQMNILTGTAEEIKSELDVLHARYKIDEFILHTPLTKLEERYDSFKRLSPKRLKRYEARATVN